MDIPTWKGAMLYLDDLVVKEKYRNNGIGKQLLDELIKIEGRTHQSDEICWIGTKTLLLI